MGQIGFDNDKYLAMQSAHIRERISKFGGKLYLEFGGKLFDDFHASRVLPGFQPDSKIRMLQQLRDDAEIVIAVNANDIEKNKVRGDLGITYDDDCLRLIDAFRSLGLYVGGQALLAFLLARGFSFAASRGGSCTGCGGSGGAVRFLPRRRFFSCRACSSRRSMARRALICSRWDACS